MTTMVSASIVHGRIRPIGERELEKLVEWKRSHSSGEVFDVVLDDGRSTALSAAARRYFATMNEWARINNISPDDAHIELKWAFGVKYPVDQPPQGRLVRLTEYHGQRAWLLSIKDYDRRELSQLLAGASQAVLEAE